MRLLNKSIIILQTIMGEIMGIIACGEDCKHQKDGYCNLENAAKITNTEKKCPYFENKLFNKVNSISDSSYTNKLDVF